MPLRQALLEKEKARFQESLAKAHMIRFEQRAAVAFTCVAVAVVIILLITLWGYLF